MTEVYPSGGVWLRVEGHSVVLNNTSADLFSINKWSDSQGAAAYLIS
jgi:vacuolar-type H+-ATPase subunit E/Vma4